MMFIAFFGKKNLLGKLSYQMTEAATEAAVVIHFEGEAGLCGAAAKLDEKCGGFISGEECGEGDESSAECHGGSPGRQRGQWDPG